MGLSECRVEATIAVSDLDAARSFYETKLGLTEGAPEPQTVRSEEPTDAPSSSTSPHKTRNGL